MRSSALFAAVLLLGAGPSFWPSAKALAADLKPKSRMTIIRELTAEYATLKTPLPRGEKGLRLETSGEVDEKALLREITQNGTAIQPSVLIQVTAIAFRDKEIVLEINGGGTKKTKWYEHIEVGMGSQTTPLSTGKSSTPTGSTVTLAFSSRLPDLTVDELKDFLAPVLDFNPTTPLQTLTRQIPPEFQAAIEAGQAVAGMDRDMVLAALGHPDSKVRETTDGVEQEDWIYGTPPMKVTFVTFEGDEVIDIQEYLGGVSGKTKDYPEEPLR